MNALCVLLMTLWLASVINHVMLGGLVHLLALATVLIVCLTENHGPRRHWRWPRRNPV
jgi:hypothetical protein